MARKTLLTENELRRFMALADMRPIGDRRLNEMGGFPLEEEDVGDEEVEDLEAEFGGLDGEPDDVVAVDADVDVEDDVPMDDLSLDAGAPADPALEEKFTEFMTQVAAVAQEVLGIDVAVEGDEGAEEMGALDMGPEDEMAAVDDLEMSEPTGEEGGEELEITDVTDEEEMPPGMRYEAKEDDLVAEVSRRVAERLKKESKTARRKAHETQVVDQLAERIMKRLTK